MMVVVQISGLNVGLQNVFGVVFLEIMGLCRFGFDRSFFLEAAALLAFAVSFLGAAFLAGAFLAVLFVVFSLDSDCCEEAFATSFPSHASTKSG